MKKKSEKKTMAIRKDTVAVPDGLLKDIRFLIHSARRQVARAVNTGMVMLNWRIGERVRKDILGQKRAVYGGEIVASLARQLEQEYGGGFSRASLFRMIQFVERYPDEQIVASLVRQLTWTHFTILIAIKDQLRRDFYTELCRVEGWNVRTLRNKIGSMLYERSGLSRKPAALARKELDALKKDDIMTPDIVFRDPYFLDFLGLKDTYSEKDLEKAILRELERFLMELGTDFTFVARQKRITIGSSDHYIDLLFYHRRLKRLVVIELKLGKFQPQDKGQVELYLRWLEKHEKRPGENPPVGLILCAEKENEEIELLRLDKSGIRVSEYLTELPPRKVLQKKLHDMIQLSRKKLENESFE